MARSLLATLNHAEIRSCVAYSQLILRLPRTPLAMSAMTTLFSTAQRCLRGSRLRSSSHLAPVIVGCALGMGAIVLVTFLLWPTWGPDGSSAPARLPMSVGATLFNVPTAAIRMKIQRHSGAQERVDLSFNFPSLEPPDASKHVSTDAVEQPMQPIDRIFVSIAA